MSLFTDVLPGLITSTPAEGRDLAIKIARKTVAAILPDEERRKQLRPDYAEDSGLLIQAAQVVALEFQTIAKANNYWRHNQDI